MNIRILLLLYGVAISSPLNGQVGTAILRDTVATIDRPNASASRDRQRNLESLAAGRRRWARAAVTEYRIQTRTYCFCRYTKAYLDSVRERSLLSVRAGAIVRRSAGRPPGSPANGWNVDTLFARVERDIRQDGRVVRKLQLDQRYGFPRDYYAETRSEPDTWIGIHVDSFAVISRGPPNTR